MLMKRLVRNTRGPMHRAAAPNFNDVLAAGLPPQGVRCVLLDGGAHAVDSSEMAFKIAAVQVGRANK